MSGSQWHERCIMQGRPPATGGAHGDAWACTDALCGAMHHMHGAMHGREQACMVASPCRCFSDQSGSLHSPAMCPTPSHWFST